jgi:transcriptional regulator with XRE-family HTH domain
MASQTQLIRKLETERHLEGAETPDLTVLLAKYALRVRRLKGKTQANIARDAWLDNSYVSRLLSGQRLNPSRDALILLGCWGLELSVDEMDELLIAAEFRPLVLPASIR